MTLCTWKIFNELYRQCHEKKPLRGVLRETEERRQHLSLDSFHKLTFKLDIHSGIPPCPQLFQDSPVINLEHFCRCHNHMGELVKVSGSVEGACSAGSAI